mgnify:FL=1
MKNRRIALIACAIVILIISGVIYIAGRLADSDADISAEEITEKGSQTENDIQKQQESYTSDPQIQVDHIDITEEERERIEGLMDSVGDCSRDIYAAADKGNLQNIVLAEATVHEMAGAVAAQGRAVTCGSYDFNMLNYEKTDECLRDAVNGKSSETEFFQITTSGRIMYFGLESKQKNLVVTYANAAFNKNLELHIQQMEKFKVYDWSYTEKGWLIWEKALSQNHEMDMHSFFRILPLDEKCRQLGNEYIRPVSYFSNNLFLVDWDGSSLDKIEFNDLYEFLYKIKYGESVNTDDIQNGIGKEDFENVIRTFFDISAEELEKLAGYDFDKGLYPWEPIMAWNHVKQFQPFPEVVKCVDNQDGTYTLYVEAVFVEEGKDCSFHHTVIMRKERVVCLAHIKEVEK